MYLEASNMPQEDISRHENEKSVVINEARRVLENWHRRSREAQMASFNAAKWFRFWHFLVGIPLILVTAVTGTEEYRSAAALHQDFYRVSPEAIGIAVPIIVALQTFLSYSQRAEKFQHVGAQYSSIRRKIEQGAVFYMSDNSSSAAFLDTVRPALDTLAEEAPDPPLIVRKWTQYHLKSDPASPLFRD
jgi:hypothetical protein